MSFAPLPSPLAENLKRPSLPSLDGLRAIAVFLVVLYHFGLTTVNGGQGVLIFFVISGFLITWLLLKEEEKWGSVSLTLFYLRRTLRIFPAFYAFWFLVVVGFAILGKHVYPAQAAASFFYVNNYYQALAGDPDSALSHTWSLAIEEQFYLLWPTLFIALRTPARRMRALATAIMAVWIYRAVAVLVFDVPQGYVYEALDIRSDHLMVGCLLATLLHCSVAPRVWRRVCARPALIWVTLTLFAASSLMPALVSWRYRDLIGFTLDPLLVAVLIVQGLAFADSSAAWMNVSVMRWLGRMSYSIYLYQQITVLPVKEELASLPTAIQLPAAIAACVAVSAASYYIIEKPFLALKDRWGKRRSAVPVLPPVSAALASVASRPA
jgi:peptidoglycan/LPS O-acetylase OafA/YrhL